MKILFTAGSLERGGKERRMLSLMEDLAERDVELALIAGSTSPLLEEARPLCQKVYEYRARAKSFNLREHLRAAEEFRPDLIHSWNRSCTTYSILAGWRHHCRVVTSEITNARPVGAWTAEFWATRFNFAGSAVVLSNSHAGVEAKHAPERKSEVIYNGYRFSRLKEVNQRTYAHLHRPGYLNVVMAARFTREKDFETVLKTARLAEERGLPLAFVLAGDGSGLSRCQNAVKAAGLGNAVFPGHVADIDNLLCQMDVGILATDPRHHQEGIPNSVMECMAHGLPVVVSDGPAIPEIVKDGCNGFIVPPRNPEELLEKLTLLAKDRRLVAGLGENAVRTVKERFDLATMGDRFMRIYRKVLDGRLGKPVETVEVATEYQK